MSGNKQGNKEKIFSVCLQLITTNTSIAKLCSLSNFFSFVPFCIVLLIYYYVFLISNFPLFYGKLNNTSLI